MDKSSRWMKITLFGTPLLPITLIAVAIISLTAGSVIRTFKQVKDRVAASLQTIADLKKHFIQKPFSRDTFAAKVREVLDHSLCIARI